jgi:molecular chaperone GrpE
MLYLVFKQGCILVLDNIFNHNENDNQENLHQPVQESGANNELVKCQADLQQYKESLLRISADFENFKKRTLREKATWIEEAHSAVILNLLDIVDNFDRAFAQPISNEENQIFGVWLQGFEMIRKSLYELLARYDVKELAPNLPFDPQFHEAISQVDSTSVASGEIVQTVQKGFLVKDRVLRVAKVIVAK